MCSMSISRPEGLRTRRASVNTCVTSATEQSNRVATTASKLSLQASMASASQLRISQVRDHRAHLCCNRRRMCLSGSHKTNRSTAGP